VTGQAVVFTATVAVVAPGAGTPTGTVTFFDGPIAVGTVTLNAARQAVLTTNALVVDTHPITASYAGDANVAPSTSSIVMETIGQGGTSTTLTASPNPVKATQSVTITATVNVKAPAVGTPTGVVIFWDGATVLGMAPLNASRKATFTTSALAVGAHPLQVMYGGDSGFAGSTSLPLTEKVNP
jgi:Big-like domain-containing protein